jgi:hypothetical protein
MRCAAIMTNISIDLFADEKGILVFAASTTCLFGSNLKLRNWTWDMAPRKCLQEEKQQVGN